MFADVPSQKHLVISILNMFIFPFLSSLSGYFTQATNVYYNFCCLNCTFFPFQQEIEASRQRHDGDLREKNRLARMLEKKVISHLLSSFIGF